MNHVGKTKDSPTNPVLQYLAKTNVLLRKILDELKKGGSDVQYFDTQTVAKKLNISKGHVRHLIREGKIHAIKMGKGNKQSHYMVPKKALEEFLKREERC